MNTFYEKRHLQEIIRLVTCYLGNKREIKLWQWLKTLKNIPRINKIGNVKYLEEVF